MIAELIIALGFLRNRSQTVTSTPTQKTPTTIKGKTFGESLRGLAYPVGWDAEKIVVNLDPQQVALYKESERVKKALR